MKWIHFIIQIKYYKYKNISIFMSLKILNYPTWSNSKKIKVNYLHQWNGDGEGIAQLLLFFPIIRAHIICLLITSNTLPILEYEKPWILTKSQDSLISNISQTVFEFQRPHCWRKKKSFLFFWETKENKTKNLTSNCILPFSLRPNKKLSTYFPSLTSIRIGV